MKSTVTISRFIHEAPFSLRYLYPYDASHLLCNPILYIAVTLLLDFSPCSAPIPFAVYAPKASFRREVG